jgi:hypothetical protein
MTLQEAMWVLKIYQEWRLGAKDLDMLEPKVITQAIDVILKKSKELYTKQEFLDAAKLGEVSMIDAKHIISLLDEIKIKSKE